MAILKVSNMGHPVLRQKAKPLTPKEIESPPIQQLIDNMVETMREYHGVGLAAPQVHVSKRLTVVEVMGGVDDAAQAVVPLTILLNPTITWSSTQTADDWEGCLSIPEIRGLVPRAKQIEVEALDREGNEVKFRADGFFARVLQHEIDHLDGILFMDRMRDLRSLTFQEEYLRYAAEHAG